MSAVHALQSAGSAGSVGRASVQDLGSPSSCALTPNAVYYLFTSFCLSWDMRTDINVTCLLEYIWTDVTGVCQCIYLVWGMLAVINKGMCVRAGLTVFAKFRAVQSLGSHERVCNSGSYRAWGLLQLCCSCLPAAIPEGKSPEARLACCNAARRQT